MELHEQDTLVAGAGLCNPEAVRILVTEGPGLIEQLIEWGAEFDREGSRLTFTREAAHSRNRVLHAHGDSTGREISRALYHKSSSIPNITFNSFSAVTDLLLNDDVQLVTLVGKAGTGKTLLALAAGLQRAVEESGYLKLLVARPIFPLGKEIGRAHV